MRHGEMNVLKWQGYRERIEALPLNPVESEFTEIESAFPEACQEVVSALKEVFDHEEKTRKDQMSDEECLAYHQAYSAPIMETLKSSMENQIDQREVEPNSSLGQ